ncbi:hypothetical protein BJV74DRAFT_593153 [Russula compacta]|nr:hypothetical protein BJV74DRAFT_593153 [Russula compacta]
MSDNSATPPSAFVLNASGMSATQMCLLASSSNSSNSTLSPTEIGVTLRVAMFNVSAASITPYCATFDPDPPAPAPLKAEECTDDPVSKSMNDGNGSENNGCTGDVDDAVPQTASLSSVTEVDDSDSASTPSVDWSSTSNNTVSTADPSQVAPSNSSEGNISGAQNVALVFVSTNPEVLDTPADASANISSIPATTTGVEASNNALSTATGSSTSAIASSTSGSLNTITSPIVQTAVSSVTPSPIPSLAALASGANSTSSMVLGVQVVPESASNAASTSASASPIMTPGTGANMTGQFFRLPRCEDSLSCFTWHFRRRISVGVTVCHVYSPVFRQSIKYCFG